MEKKTKSKTCINGDHLFHIDHVTSSCLAPGKVTQYIAKSGSSILAGKGRSADH